MRKEENRKQKLRILYIYEGIFIQRLLYLISYLNFWRIFGEAKIPKMKFIHENKSYF